MAIIYGKPTNATKAVVLLKRPSRTPIVQAMPIMPPPRVQPRDAAKAIPAPRRIRRAT